MNIKNIVFGSLLVLSALAFSYLVAGSTFFYAVTVGGFVFGIVLLIDGLASSKKKRRKR